MLRSGFENPYGFDNPVYDQDLRGENFCIQDGDYMKGMRKPGERDGRAKVEVHKMSGWGAVENQG
jgi:hypothetical protein